MDQERNALASSNRINNKVTMNTIDAITAYRTPFDRNFWAFDDERHGLKQELFLTEASKFLTEIVGEECEKATLIFATVPFPDQNTILTADTALNPDTKGAFYLGQHPIPDNNGVPYVPPRVEVRFWLCPALCHYFGKERAPEHIYARITPS